LAGASPDGALDLVGNVKEWVADAFTKTYYLDSPLVDPKGPPGTAIERTIRGSSYMTAQGSEAVYLRYGHAPTFTSDELGFRCAQGL
jgi:formylglycine-generating enzyme required for sulfatase activity